MMDKTRWCKLLEKLDFTADELTFEKLELAYNEKHRAYHTVTHISHCLVNFDAHRKLTEKPDAVELAIWFHDSIYRPFSNTNEEDSADWAVEFLGKQNASSGLSEVVYKLIMATKHNVENLSNDESVLVDIDLAILGSEPQEYAVFESDIRTEYKRVPKLVFNKKRANLLQSFLSREHIYSHEPFQELYESKARINITSAIETLLG